MSREITLTIGRASASHIRFDDGTVSRNHATLTIGSDGTYLLADVGSTHGTKVSGQEIKDTGGRRIRPNDVIEFGSMRISAQDLQRKAAEAWRVLQQTKGNEELQRRKEQEQQQRWEQEQQQRWEQEQRNQRQPQTTGPMTFGRAISTCFKKYATFSGRASRGEYWWFQLFLLLVCFGVGILLVALAFPIIALTDPGDVDETTAGVLSALMVGFCMLIGLILAIPNLAVSVRRLHDTNRGGAWLLLHFVPLGPLFLLIWSLEEGNRATNDYGPNPLGEPRQNDYYY